MERFDAEYHWINTQYSVSTNARILSKQSLKNNQTLRQ